MYKPCKYWDVKLPTSTGKFAGFLVAINSIISLPLKDSPGHPVHFQGLSSGLVSGKNCTKRIHLVSFRREFFSLRLDLGMPSYEDFCERYCDFQLVEET